MNRYKVAIFLLLSLRLNLAVQAQNEDIDRWDNWLITGQKVVFGGQKNYKHSHELQWRADENLKNLNTLLYEAVFTYSPNQHWEIVPDIRYSIKSAANEIRPGFGIIRKDYIGAITESSVTQFAQQVKWQADIKNGRPNTQAVRYAPSISHIINGKYVVGGLLAGVYQWGGGFSGLAFVRG
ncbi:MAG: hypothetical protein OCD76_08430 [Reichenbachiella sp.]